MIEERRPGWRSEMGALLREIALGTREGLGEGLKVVIRVACFLGPSALVLWLILPATFWEQLGRPVQEVPFGTLIAVGCV